MAVHEIILDESGVPEDYRFLMVNPSFERLTGLESAKILGKTCKEVLPDIETHWIERFGRVALSGEAIEFEEYSGALGRYYQVLAYQPYEGVFATIVTDITEKKLTEKELQFRSDHDSLTGLFNRRHFDEELARRDDEGNYPLTLILVDIDDLKVINHVHGQKEGDKAIQKVANLLKETCCTEDCLIARTGGDEFTCLLTGEEEMQASVFIKRIKEKVTEKIFVSGKPLSVSMGFAVKKGPHQRIGDVFREAEKMLYKNKIMLKRGSIGTVEMIMQALREKNQRERIHADQVALICEEIGKEMCLSDDSRNELFTAAKLHDIGKIGVSEKILDKPDILTEEEYEIVKRHCESGYKILAPILELESVAMTILAHHERFDGKGYPYGIVGEKMPLHARIISVADTFSAMISERPYRDKFSPEEAKQEIMHCSGTQFDPVIVDAFLDRFSQICDKTQNV